MLKRTAEKVMGIIGVVLIALIGAFSGVMLALTGNEEIRTEMIKVMSSNQNISGTDAIATIDGIFTFLLWGSVISVILALIALFTLKKNARAILSGIFFILAAISTAISATLLGTIPAILFLITGILALVKKPENTVQPNQTFEG